MIRLFSSVNFAVTQIITLSLLAVVGMTIRQLPGFAFRSAGDYAAAMADLHARYDPAFGAGIVSAMERLQVFHIFSSTWFTVGLIVLVFSIIVCTLSRTPKLWRQSAEIRVVQPDPFYDPELPDRAAMTGIDAAAVRAALRSQRFVVREAEQDGVRYLYGDRHRWTKLATLISHLGLILFLVAAVVTWRLGDEQGLVVAEGDSLTVQPIGTPGLLVVKNYQFEAPGFLETGQASDFTTDLGVFQDGREVARKTIRVNDPLAVAGYTFHQNGFGPAPDLLISDATGKPLWDGPVPLTDQAAGFPFGTLAVPGRDIGLQLLLRRQADGTGVVLVLPYRVVGRESNGSPKIEELSRSAVAVAAGEAQVLPDLDFSLGVKRFSDYTLIIAKKDPGQGIVWAAFGSLILGLAITFYLPRRRIWARLTPAGELALVARSDRYVDLEREFGRLLDDLVARRAAIAERRPPGSASAATSGARRPNPMATLDELRAAVAPSARWLSRPAAGSPGERVDLAWVRLMRARVPAFDALEPGDVAIVPATALAVVAPDRDGVAALVRGCVEAEIGGLLIVTEAGDTSLSLMALREAAAAAGLPALDVGAADPAAVERSVIGFLVNHRAELERQATLLESRLEQVALGGGGPDGLAAAIAGFLGRAVAIEGRRGATLAVHAPADVVDAAAAVSAYHGRRRRAAARVALPIPGGEPDPAGALALLGDRPPSELERVATARIAGLLALELARDEALGRAIEGARRETLPADGPPWIVIVGRQAPPDPGDETGGSASPADAARRERERRETLRRDLRSLAPARRLSLRGDAQSVELRIVAAVDAVDPDGVVLAGQIGGFLGRLVAVSRPFAEPAGRSAAEADARATLEAAEALADPPSVARADRLPAYRLLGSLHNLPDGRRQAHALLAPLLRGRADVRRERLATLRAVLDQPGLAEAADALGVHRNTVAYRVHRIEEATGWRLADPELRFPLGLALRLVQDD